MTTISAEVFVSIAVTAAATRCFASIDARSFMRRTIRAP